MTADPEVVAELDGFLTDELPLHAAEFGERSDSEAGIAWQRRLDRGGWVGLHWPKEFGGRDLDLATQVACESALSGAGAPAIGGFIGVNTVASALMEWGSSGQSELLPKIRSGEIVACQGFSEPGAGSDLACLRTRAHLDDGHFVLDGQKVWTSHGAAFDVGLVLARSTPLEGGGRSHRGLSTFLVPLDLPGITVTPIRQLNGAEEFTDIFSDGARDFPNPHCSARWTKGGRWR